MKAAVKVTNTYSWLTTDTLKVKDILHKGLRFRAKNYFHSRLYKQRLWDGYDEFFKKETGRFLTGLLPEVEYALKALKCEYIIQDERTPPKIICSKVTTDFLEKRNPNPSRPFILTDYQCDLPTQALEQMRCTIQAPTSAGKTAMMMSVLDCIDPNILTLIMAGKVQPVAQAYDELVKWGYKNVGRVYGKYNEPNKIICANVDSLHKLEPILPHIKCLIADEVHDKIITATGKKYISKMTGCGMRIAISATPFKFDGNDKTHKFFVKGLFGPLLKTKSESAVDGIIQTKKLQESGRLSKSKCTFYVIRSPELPFCLYQDAVTQGIAQNWGFHKVVAQIVSKKRGRTLIIVERIEHGDALNAIIPNSLWVRGQDNQETRKHIIKQLQSATGDVVAIATNGIFNAAINVFIHNLVNAYGGQAEHAIKQLFGRGLRTADDKETLDYTDFIFLINEYLEKHSKKRVKVIKKEGHPIEIKEISEI